MHNEIQDFYLKFSTFTYPGCYREFLNNLPKEVEDIGLLVRKQIIHRTTLRDGNTGSNTDLKYGDMNRIAWHRLKCDDDILVTASSMIAELLRLEDGFTLNRKAENKIIVTCRYTSVLMSSILKSKGIPARSRSGFTSCFGGKSADHWINQYWNAQENRWVTIDVDGSLHSLDFNPYDIPENKFGFAANTWLGLRKKNIDPEEIVYAGGENGLKAAIRAIFYDFHSLMNNEISYLFQPSFIANKFNELTEDDFAEIDKLAELMLNPDKNFSQLFEIWNNNKRFRLLNTPLIGDDNHKEIK